VSACVHCGDRLGPGLTRCIDAVACELRSRENGPNSVRPCQRCGRPAPRRALNVTADGLSCVDEGACARRREHDVARRQAAPPRGLETMQGEVGRAVDLFGRWLMGDDVLASIDKEHGTRLATMRDMALAKVAEVRGEVEHATATREAALAAQGAPVSCGDCHGMGARMMNGAPAVCQACAGTGKAGAPCEACDGHGAVLESCNGKTVPKPCRACGASGRKGP
jgi:hypothetical protein